jgi:hypothetical protein
LHAVAGGINLSKANRVGDDGQCVAGFSRWFAASHKRPDATNDFAGALGLPPGFRQCIQQLFAIKRLPEELQDAGSRSEEGVEPNRRVAADHTPSSSHSQVGRRGRPRKRLG